MGRIHSTCVCGEKGRGERERGMGEERGSEGREDLLYFVSYSEKQLKDFIYLFIFIYTIFPEGN